MPRIARVLAVGFPHHVTQRGNYAQGVFSNDNDRRKYLSWLIKYSGECNLSILAYCLMSNHVHFIVVPNAYNSMAQTFSRTHARYSLYHNRKRDVAGHLWQGRFYSCVLGENHLLAAAKYVELNPVRAGLVATPWEWRWSSAAAHIGLARADLPGIEKFFDYSAIAPSSWKDFLATPPDYSEDEGIRHNTFKGRPFADAVFIRKLEIEYGRSLRVQCVGRPRKNPKKTGVCP
jgi:putative transposase